MGGNARSAKSSIGVRVGAAIVLASLLTPGPTRGGSPAKERLTLADLYRLDAPRSTAVAPDGSQAVYVRQWNEPATKQEPQSLWLVRGKAADAKPLEEGEPDARWPVWSTDGKWLAFLSTRPRPKAAQPTPRAPAQSDPATGTWLMPAQGGRAL